MRGGLRGANALLGGCMPLAPACPVDDPLVDIGPTDVGGGPDVPSRPPQRPHGHRLGDQLIGELLQRPWARSARLRKLRYRRWSTH